MSRDPTPEERIESLETALRETLSLVALLITRLPVKNRDLLAPQWDVRVCTTRAYAALSGRHPLPPAA